MPFDYDFPIYGPTSTVLSASPSSTHVRPNYLHAAPSKLPRTRPTPSSPASDSSSSSLDNHSHRHTHARRRRSSPFAARPSWERGFADDADVVVDEEDDDDEDDSEDLRFRAQRPRSPPAYYHYSHHHYYDSPPRSYESDDAPLRAASPAPSHSSSFQSHEHSHEVARKLALGLGVGLRRKWRDSTDAPPLKLQLPTSLVQDPEEPSAEDEDEEERCLPESNEKVEFTPSCTDAMRQRWQAFSLSWRFSVFRAKRRIRRRVGL